MATSKEQVGLADISPHSPRSTGTIYRIINFCHLVDLFQNKELHFSHPSTWEDKFETRLQHDDYGSIFAQCWSHQYSSDAMWRIYSQNFMGVRISTSAQQFLQVISKANKTGANLRFRLQDVRYLNFDTTTLALRHIRDRMNVGDGLYDASDALFYKRHSFDHEAECRALLITEKSNTDAIRTGIKLKVDPHAFVQRILLDPRMSDQLAETFTFFIKEKLKYKGPVSKSALYAMPKPI